MRLQLQTDYALRVLLVLASSSEELTTVAQIATIYDISQNHLVKVANHLTHLGWVEAVRGRHGGLRLAVEPGSVRVGDVVRAFEGEMHLLTCVGASASDCRVHSVCGLRHLLGRAEDAFFAELDGTTLADLTPPASRLVKTLRKSKRASDKSG